MKSNQVYKCPVCGNIVEVAHVGGGELVCCQKPMIAMPELNHDAGEEKHVPVITPVENGVKVHIGSIDHPMQEDHYIERIEVITERKVYKVFLQVSDTPEVIFPIVQEEITTVRTYCNLHGLRKA